MKKEIKVGLMAAIAAVVFIFGLNYLKGEDFFSDKKTFYATYSNIGGLMVSNPVMVNGFTVGRVEQISILGPEKNYALRVAISVNEDVMVTDSSKAVLTSSDLLGGKAIVLKLGKGNVLETGSDIIAVTERSLTDVIADKAIPVIDKADDIFAKISNTMDSSLQNSVQRSVKEIEQTILTYKYVGFKVNGLLSDVKPRLDATLKNFQQLSDSLKMLTSTFNKTGENLQSFTDKLNKTQLQATIDRADSVMTGLNHIVNSLNEGEGTLGKLITDKSMHDSLTTTLHSLNSVIQDFQAHPKNYLKPLGKRNNP